VIDFGSVNLTPIFTTQIFGQGYGAQFIYHNDDESCVIFANPQGAINYASNIFVVDSSGAYTRYTIINDGSFKAIVPFGNGIFQCLLDTGTIYYAKVANLKLNNASPVLIRDQSLPFTMNCPDIIEPSLKVYLDISHRLVAGGIYSANGQTGGQVYSVVARLTGAGQLTTPLTSGVCGTYSSDPPFDPFDHTAPVTASAAYQSNGILSYLADADNTLIIGAKSVGINIGQNAGCNVADGVTGSYVYDRYNSVVNTGVGYGNNALFVDSSIPNMIGFTYSASFYPYPSVLTAYSGAFAGTVSFPSRGIFDSLQSCVIGSKSIFAVGKDTNNYLTVFQVDNPGFTAGNAIGNLVPTILVNSARPISVTGKYKS